MRQRALEYSARLGLALLVSLFLVSLPTSAWAQDEGFADDGFSDDAYADEEGGDEEAPASEEGAQAQGDTVAVPGAEPGIPGPNPDFQGAPQTYVVQEGDTLWDITQRFVGNAWYWPKVWSFNGQVENPNWIYPGNVIRFFPSGDALPTLVQAEESPEDLGDGEEIPEEFGGLGEDEPVVSVAGELSYQKRPTTRVAHAAFVSKESLSKAGQIVGAFEERYMMSVYDRIYASFKGSDKPQPGSRFTIFRKGAEVFHPKTGASMGFMTQVVGEADVIETGKRETQTMIITKVLDGVERGDFLAPYKEPILEDLLHAENKVNLDGVIFATMVPELRTLGEHHYVFIDKGARHGVEKGNIFEIIRRGDPMRGTNPAGPLVEDERFPWELIGQVLVTEVHGNSCVGLVVNSVLEFDPGERAVMRAAAPASASR